MCVHGQFIVIGDAKVTHLVNWVDSLTTNVQRCDIDRRQLLTCASQMNSVLSAFNLSRFDNIHLAMLRTVVAICWSVGAQLAYVCKSSA